MKFSARAYKPKRKYKTKCQYVLYIACSSGKPSFLFFFIRHILTYAAYRYDIYLYVSRYGKILHVLGRHT